MSTYSIKVFARGDGFWGHFYVELKKTDSEGVVVEQALYGGYPEGVVSENFLSHESGLASGSVKSGQGYNDGVRAPVRPIIVSIPANDNHKRDAKFLAA